MKECSEWALKYEEMNKIQHEFYSLAAEWCANSSIMNKTIKHLIKLAEIGSVYSLSLIGLKNN